ncbi:MAG: glycogen debranching protein GlgX [bacterium]|nr:glycogen debranching protein GlgX [bacterium]
MTVKLEKFTTSSGLPYPLGATCNSQGTNFSIHCPKASSLDLLLFENVHSSQPFQTITLQATEHRTATYWHVFLEKCHQGQIYAWRARGPRDPEKKLFFDGDKVLLDPYAKAICGQEKYSRSAAKAVGDNCARALRSVVVDPSQYDWQGDQPLPAPNGREIIYEMHVSGFTKSPSSGLDESLSGTYKGLIEKISYLQELGITAVEFLPVHEYDSQDAPKDLANFWGYSTLGFFAPHRQYSSDQSPVGPVNEFRDLVRELHKAGIRVILDVVFNHTSEAGIDGPTLGWRGLDAAGYYILNNEPSVFSDFTGCGNTFNCNSPTAMKLVLDSLRYWVREMHVDGFRFDLASAMTRDVTGTPMSNPPLIAAINSDPELAGCTLIAEAWDAAGLYQVGSFPGDRFSEWNGPFRDIGRSFWRGDDHTIENLMARLVGSPDLMNDGKAVPSQSINFLTCHDGFSLWDLVSYEKKHNLKNKEENRDGSNHNISCNHGQEGPSSDKNINELRHRQIRNFFCLLMLSHGTPMFYMGDEVGQSKDGNNNPWCQDNELNWFDWNLVKEQKPLLKFVQSLIFEAKNIGKLSDDRFWSASSDDFRGDITWHGLKPGLPDWTPTSHCLAFEISPGADGRRILVLFNASDQSQIFELPELPKNLAWDVVLTTSKPGLQGPDSCEKGTEPLLQEILLSPKSTMVLQIQLPIV